MSITGRSRQVTLAGLAVVDEPVGAAAEQEDGTEKKDNGCAGWQVVEIGNI